MKLSKWFSLFLILFLCSVVSGQSYIDTVQSLTPILYYPMNETTGTTAYDSSGGGRNGSYANCTLNDTGIISSIKSVGFNGTNSRLTPPASTYPIFNTDSGSVMMWIKVNNWTVGTPFALHIFTATFNSIQYIIATKIFHTFNINGTNDYYDGQWLNIDTTTLLGGSWHCVIHTWSKLQNTALTYVDDKRVIPSNEYNSTKFSTYAGWTGGAPVGFTIGSHGWAGNYFNGKINHFALWDRPLSRSEINSLVKGYKRQYSAVCFGNSLTGGACVGVTVNTYDSTYPYFLSKLMNKTVANNGIGSTPLQATAITTNWPSGVPENGYSSWQYRILDHNPEYVFLWYGVNDFFWNGNSNTWSSTTFRNAYDSTLKWLIQNGVSNKKIFVGGMPLLSNTSMTATRTVYQDSIKSVSIKHSVNYVDLETYLIANGNHTNISSDSIHYNGIGYKHVAEAFYNVYKTTVSSTSTGSKRSGYRQINMGQGMH